VLVTNPIKRADWKAIKAGTELTLPNGSRVYKCADQWNHHYTDGWTVFNPSNGRLEHMSWHVQFED
jgi:hypothetical protein